MQLSRALIDTPIGEMIALASDEGLCALEFTTVRGRGRGKERMTRLNARLARWFPPHEIVDRESATRISFTRSLPRISIHMCPPPPPQQSPLLRARGGSMTWSPGIARSRSRGGA